ncbi:hypothetical protein Scep_011470 [Stephania cephalantha]|uniref:Uncharacterized protein n=1 Tax=Stephania cephalantha TaxID=152367 RepID=A0AAP0JFE2_9MAGN
MEARHRQDREADQERHHRDLERSRKEMKDRFARLEELVSEGVCCRDIRPTSCPTPYYDMGYLPRFKKLTNFAKLWAKFVDVQGSKTKLEDIARKL